MTLMLSASDAGGNNLKCLLCRKPGLNMTSGPGRSMLPLELPRLQLARASATRRWGMPSIALVLSASDAGGNNLKCLLCRRPGLNMTSSPGRSVLPLELPRLQLAWACATWRWGCFQTLCRPAGCLFTSRASAALLICTS